MSHEEVFDDPSITGKEDDGQLSRARTDVEQSRSSDIRLGLGFGECDSDYNSDPCHGPNERLCNSIYPASQHCSLQHEVPSFLYHHIMIIQYSSFMHLGDIEWDHTRSGIVVG